MAAKQGLLGLLKSAPKEDELNAEDVLQYVRKQKMSKTSLSKIMLDVWSVAEKTQNATVEAMVAEMINLARTKAPEDLFSQSQVPEDDGSVSSSLTCTVNKQTISGEFQPNAACMSPAIPGSTDGCALPEKSIYVNVPVSLLENILEKIDSLTGLVVKQKEEMLDIEARLKHEIKQREERVCDALIDFVGKQKEEMLNIESRLKHEFKQREERVVATVKELRSKNTQTVQSVKDTSQNTHTVQSPECTSNSPGADEMTSQKDQKKKPISRWVQKTTKSKMASNKQQPATSNNCDHEGHLSAINDGIKAILRPDTDSDATYANTQRNHDTPTSGTDLEQDKNVCVVHMDPLTVETESDEDETKENQWKTTKTSRLQNKGKPALGKLLGAQRLKKQVYYLGGVSPDCSAEDILEFCTQHCRLVECRMMNSRRTGTQSARIVVPADDAAAIESIPWPNHVYVRRWEFDTANDRNRVSKQLQNSEAPLTN